MENPFQIIIDYLIEIKRIVAAIVADIKEISHKTSSNDADEVLDFLGFCQFLKISKATAYKYTSQNLVPHIKREGRLYFLKSELLAWLKSGKIKTKWELDEEAQMFIQKRNIQ